MASILEQLLGAAPGGELLADNPYAGIARSLQGNIAPEAKNSSQAFLFPLIQGLAQGVIGNFARDYEEDKLFDYYKNNPLIKALSGQATASNPEGTPEDQLVTGMGPVASGDEYGALLQANPYSGDRPDYWTPEQGKADLAKGLLAYQNQEAQREMQREIAKTFATESAKRLAETAGPADLMAMLKGETPTLASGGGVGTDPLGLSVIPKEYRAKALAERQIEANAEKQVDFAMRQYEDAKKLDSLSAALPWGVTPDSAELNGIRINLTTALQKGLGREMNNSEREDLARATPKAFDSVEIIEAKKQRFLDLLKNGVSEATPTLDSYGIAKSQNPAYLKTSSMQQGAADPSAGWSAQKIADRLSQGFLSLNDALTFGAGDEIAAGGNAVLDALLEGKDISQAYDERLNQARKIEADTPLGLKLGAAILGAGSLPLKAATTIGQAVKQGAGLGAAYGFGEGEGDVVERLKSAGTSAAIGGAASGVLGTAGAVINKIKGDAPKLADAANASVFGIGASDLKASAKNAALVKGDTGEIVGPKLLQITKDLTKSGFLDDGLDPTTLVNKATSKIESLGKQINPILKQADRIAKEKGVSTDVKWLATKKYIDAQTGQQKQKALEVFDEELSALTGQGLLGKGVRELNKLKQSFWTKAYGPDDKIKNEVFQRMGRDVKRTIERVTDRTLKGTNQQSVKEINEEMGKYLAVLPKLARKQASEAAQTIDQKIINWIKTTGGVGVGILSSVTTGNPMYAMGGAATLLGTTATGRRLSAKGLEQLAKKLPANSISGLSMGARPLISETAGMGQKKKMTEQTKTSDGVDVDRLVSAIIGQESGGDAKAVGYETPETKRQGARALGLMQIMPATAADIAKELGVKEYDLFDPETNVRFGRHYIQKLLKQFNNDPELALTAYHSGPGTVSKLLKETGGTRLKDIIGKLGPVGQKYAKEVLARYV